MAQGQRKWRAVLDITLKSLKYPIHDLLIIYNNNIDTLRIIDYGAYNSTLVRFHFVSSLSCKATTGKIDDRSVPRTTKPNKNRLLYVKQVCVHCGQEVCA